MQSVLLGVQNISESKMMILLKVPGIVMAALL